MASARGKGRSSRSASDFVNARPPRANMRVPSMPPCRTRATSVVPPPTSINTAPACRMTFEPSTRATAYGSATTWSNSRSSCDATLWSAPRWTSGAKALKMLMRTWRPWKPTGFVRAYPSIEAPVIAAWTSLTSTCGSPVSQVIARSASRSASRCTRSISFWSSASVMDWSGFFRSCECVVVKPLTSSPAMPMTTCDGRNPAISSASWRATEQLSTTAAMSATVPDCMCDRPCRFRPTPRTTPWPVSSISNTSAFANSVPMSSAVHAARAASPSRCQMRRQNAI